MKRYKTILSPLVFWRSRGPPEPKFTNPDNDVQQDITNLSHSDNLSMRYLLPNFADLVESVAEGPTNIANDDVSEHHAASGLSGVVANLERSKVLFPSPPSL